MKLLTEREQAMAQRAAGGGSLAEEPLSDGMVLGVGFVLARRERPTVPLTHFLRDTDVDELRDDVEAFVARHDVAPPAELLRGRGLDEALEAAGLSKGGTVAEKQARLAQAQGAGR